MEAMIAIAVLSSVTIVALNTITNAADTESLNKDYMSALMLIDSGAQEVLGLYKNNLEKFGVPNEAACGLNIALTATTFSDCNPNSATQSLYNSSYIVYLDPADQIIKATQTVGGTFTEENITNDYLVYEAPIGNGDFLLTQNAGIDPLSKPTRYFRKLNVNNTPNGTSTDVAINIQVAFQKKGGKYSIQEKTINLTLGE